MTADQSDSGAIRQTAQFLHLYQPPAINGDFHRKHIISVEQFHRQDLDILFDAVRSLRERVANHDPDVVKLCSGRLMASLFYESSTRTDMSFQAAMRRLGGSVVSASNGVQFSSVYKGENLSDTVRAAGCYANVVVLRHPQVTSALVGASKVAQIEEAVATLDRLAFSDEELAEIDRLVEGVRA